MTWKKNVLAALSVLAVGTMALTGCGGNTSSSSGSGDKIVLRYAENQVKDYPTTQAAQKFADLVKEKTNGRITVEVYDSGQLGDEKSVIEQVQFGGIDMSRVSLTPLSEFSRNLMALQFPYLYRDSEHMWKVLDGDIGKELLKSTEDSGIVGLSWYDAGTRNFYNSKHEIKSLADMQGLKIRVQESSMMMDMVKALGANPTPMPYGEVYSGLQTNVIDGAENNWPSYESTSHYEVAKYYVVDEHSRVPEMQIISKQTMDKLSADDQKIIRECAEESAKYERQLWAEREKASEEKVRAGGAVITRLSDGDPLCHEYPAALPRCGDGYGAADRHHDPDPSAGRDGMRHEPRAVRRDAHLQSGHRPLHSAGRIGALCRLRHCEAADGAGRQGHDSDVRGDVHRFDAGHLCPAVFHGAADDARCAEIRKYAKLRENHRGFY